MKKRCLFFFLLLIHFALPAQELFSNLRSKSFVVGAEPIQLDTLSIVSESFVLKDSLGQQLPPSRYRLNSEKALLKIFPENVADSNNINASYYASYRVFPFLFSKSVQHKNSTWLKPDERGKINPFNYTASDAKAGPLFASEGLNKSGSLSRGLAFGNNQDVVVNSNLNLQLSGKLTDKISILAAIADDNIPIQPEGNTQQLQEFDRVYIQFYDEKSKLTAGDFQLTRPDSYFLNYFKKSQGLSFSSGFGLGKTAEKKTGNQMKVNFSAAVSKGKFSRNVIIGVEGNQGPYRLRGAENEGFIIVLSGSEKVYIDGQLLERGQENDYVIDYNTAEITFTPKRLITKDKRITAEFQYSDRNYARSLYEFGDEYKNKRLALRFHVFSEQDNKKKPLLQELKDAEKKTLAGIGDSLQNAIVPGIDTSGYLPNTVLYEAVDSLGFSSVFVYTTDSLRAKYRLSFSYVGLGNGDYIPANTSANGKVYQWVAPVNGIKQGTYAPVILLVTPKKKQMVTFAADYLIAKNFTSCIEMAYTKNDKNTFSNYNSDDDGYGLRVLLKKKTALKSNEKDSLHLLMHLNLELVSKYFSPIERYRAVEFVRDWNRSSDSIRNQQTLAAAGIGLEKKRLGNILYQFSGFTEQAYYKGYQHLLSSAVSKNGFDFNMTSSYLTSNDVNIKSSYIKNKGLASQDFKGIKIGASVEQENSKFLQSATNNLLNNSFHFFEWQGFIQNSDTSKNTFGLKYINRTDWLSDSSQFVKTSLGQSIAANLGFSRNPASQLKIGSTFRKLSVYEKSPATLQPDNSLVSRLEYNLRIFKGSITSNTFYEVGSGLEVKKEYSFIKVQPGQGVYQWVDLDDDSLQDVNEFLVAVFQDKAEYLKVFTPTNEYVKTYNNMFNQIINLSPSAVWSNKKNFLKILSLFANQTAYRVDRKTGNNKPERFLNPFLRQSNDSEIVSINSSLRNTLFFNRFNSRFGSDYSYLENKNKTLLVNGFEERSTGSHNLKIRWNITRKWLISTETISGKKVNRSEFFDNRDFKIDYRSSEQRLSYQPGTTFRSSIVYLYSEKRNRTGELVQAFGQKLGCEVKYNRAMQSSLSASFNFIQYKYNGGENSSLSYEMLEGLQEGNNYTWNVGFQRTLSNNIQVNLSYDGRKSEKGNARIVHVGNVQVRAHF